MVMGMGVLRTLPAGFGLLMVLQLISKGFSVQLETQTPESVLDEFDLIGLEQNGAEEASTAADDKVEEYRNESKRFLKFGNEFVKFRKDIENITLVVGMSGAGKTTLTQIISGDNKELISYYNTGSGFLIKDTAKRILTDTIVSTSIFPELVIDPETGEALYDCPGFKDTRNASVEISSTRFMKKVADSYKGIKILIIVNHESLRPGHTRYGYTDLMKHMLEFINDIPKFKLSIAMIISKVDVPYKDDDVIKGAADFIKANLGSIRKTALGSQWDAVKNLTRILLQQKDGKYTNIGIFRQPTEEGLLSDLPAVQANRLKLRELAFDNPNFRHQETQSSDLRFVLSIDSKVVAAQLVDTLSMTAKAEAAKLTRELVDAYEKKMSGIQSLEMKMTALMGDSRKLESLLSSSISNRSRNSSKPLNTILEDAPSNLSISLGLDFGKTLNTDVEDLIFLEETANTPYHTSEAKKIHDQILSGFQELVSSVKSYSLWLAVSNELFQNVTRVPVESNIVKQASKLTAAPTLVKEDLSRTELPSPVLQRFLAALPTGEGEKLSLLEKLLTVFAWDVNSSGCTYTTSSNTVTITGHALTSSQVVDCLRKSKSASQDIKHLLVMSTLVFHLNVDINGPEFTRHHGLNMILITPEVKAIGNRLISLDGKRGDSYSGSATEGQTGRPGGHGGNGGKFYAGLLKIQGDVRITVNGGGGGNGQAGGKGLHGHGVNPNGKDGGAGGQGGSSGEVKFLLNISSNMGKVVASKGVPGGDGRGGAGGTQIKTTPGYRRRVVTPGYTETRTVEDGNSAAEGSLWGLFGGAVGSAIGAAIGAGIKKTKEVQFEVPEQVSYVDIPESVKTIPGSSGSSGRNTEGQGRQHGPFNLTTLLPGTIKQFQAFAGNHVTNPFLKPTLSGFLTKVSTLVST